MCGRMADRIDIYTFVSLCFRVTFKTIGRSEHLALGHFDHPSERSCGTAPLINKGPNHKKPASLLMLVCHCYGVRNRIREVQNEAEQKEGLHHMGFEPMTSAFHDLDRSKVWEGGILTTGQMMQT